MNGKLPVTDTGARSGTAAALPQFHDGGSALGPAEEGRWADDGGSDDPARSRADADRRRWAALPDGRRSQLRHLLRQVDLAILPLRPGGVVALRDLDDALQALGDALDLGPEPALKRCAVCGRLGMAGATVCGHCWTASTVRG
jgi:hypothetical protein